MEERIRRIREWTEKGFAPPFKVDVFLTHRCNLLCRFCSYPGTPAAEKRQELSRKRLLGIVEQAAEMKPHVVGILGGEPFVRRDCVIEFMVAVRRHGIAGSLVTNGTLLSRADIRAIVEMQWNLFRFSIDGARAETHDRLRGMRGSFDKAFAAMREMCALKKRAGAAVPTVEVNYVLNRENFGELAGLVRLSADAGASAVQVLPMTELCAGVEELKFGDSENDAVVQALLEADEAARACGISTNSRSVAEMNLYAKANRMDEVLAPSSQPESHVPCFLPWLGMSFDALGNASPCGQLKFSRPENVKQMSLRQIWTGGLFGKLRSAMLRCQLPSECRICCTPLVEENIQIREEFRRVGYMPFRKGGPV